MNKHDIFIFIFSYIIITLDKEDTLNGDDFNVSNLDDVFSSDSNDMYALVDVNHDLMTRFKIPKF